LKIKLKEKNLKVLKKLKNGKASGEEHSELQKYASETFEIENFK